MKNEKIYASRKEFQEFGGFIDEHRSSKESAKQMHQKIRSVLLQNAFGNDAQISFSIFEVDYCQKIRMDVISN